ncbi:MAG: hypothetical protein JO316_15575 [Abitibacteriaceae bacterium]|nr:hypothetical protein [Abditibacteriaceae bacterium]
MAYNGAIAMTPKAKLLSLCIVPVLLFIVLVQVVARLPMSGGANRLVIANRSGQSIKSLRISIIQDFAPVVPYNHPPYYVNVPKSALVVRHNYANVPNGRDIVVQYDTPASCRVEDISALAMTQDGRRGGFGNYNQIASILHRRHGHMYTLQPGHRFTYRPIPMGHRRHFLFF